MKSKAILVLLAAFSFNLFTPSLSSSVSSSISRAAQGKTLAGTPDGVVRELYKVHRMGNGPIFEGKSRTYLVKFFDRKLSGLIWKELTTHSEEVGNLDFDPLYNAQDIGIKNFRVGTPLIDKGRAVVPVTFNNYDLKVKIVFHLLGADGGWKIENLVYEDGSNLLEILSAPQ
ncbi:MAG TPA: hypothetical protein VNH22_15100 [Blastocatellia bacterium]|jgi:hypothetical protein|nr:hypothetical protein [Blastocatellia bacterium]